MRFNIRPQPQETQQRGPNKGADPLDNAYCRLGLPCKTTDDNCGGRPQTRVGGASMGDVKACVGDLRRERQRIRLDADDGEVTAVCHQGDRRDVRLMWALSPRRRPARVVVRGEDVADALHELTRWCTYRMRTLGLRRVRGLPVWVVVGRMEAWEGWRGVPWADVRYSEGEPSGPSLEWRMEALRRLFRAEEQVTKNGVAISFRDSNGNGD